MLGIIAIPGMMTGAILGGSSVHQAAKLQMIIMFMITASTTLACILTSFAAIFVTVDAEHRIREDRIHDRKKDIAQRVAFGLNLKAPVRWLRVALVRRKKDRASADERQGLLG